MRRKHITFTNEPQTVPYFETPVKSNTYCTSETLPYRESKAKLHDLKTFSQNKLSGGMWNLKIRKRTGICFPILSTHQSGCLVFKGSNRVRDNVLIAMDSCKINVAVFWENMESKSISITLTELASLSLICLVKGF